MACEKNRVGQVDQVSLGDTRVPGNTKNTSFYWAPAFAATGCTGFTWSRRAFTGFQRLRLLGLLGFVMLLLGSSACGYWAYWVYWVSSSFYCVLPLLSAGFTGFTLFFCCFVNVLQDARLSALLIARLECPIERLFLSAGSWMNTSALGQSRASGISWIK